MAQKNLRHSDNAASPGTFPDAIHAGGIAYRGVCDLGLAEGLTAMRVETWDGSVRCWWHPETQETLICSESRSQYDHADASENMPDLTVDELNTRFPDIEWDKPVHPTVLLRYLIGEEDEEDRFRTQGVLAGWVLINANPKITTIPYMMAPDNKSALKALSWMKAQGCTAMSHTLFCVEIIKIKDEAVSSVRHTYSKNRLSLPNKLGVMSPGSP